MDHWCCHNGTNWSLGSSANRFIRSSPFHSSNIHSSENVISHLGVKNILRLRKPLSLFQSSAAKCNSLTKKISPAFPSTSCMHKFSIFHFGTHLVHQWVSLGALRKLGVKLVSETLSFYQKLLTCRFPYPTLYFNVNNWISQSILARQKFFDTQ